MSKFCCDSFEDLYRLAHAETDQVKRQELLQKMETAMRAWEDTLLEWLSPAELERMQASRMRVLRQTA